MSFLFDRKEKKLYAKKYFQLSREYDERKKELKQMYAQLIQLRELAGFEDDIIDPPQIYEVPEYVPGRVIQWR